MMNIEIDRAGMVPMPEDVKAQIDLSKYGQLAEREDPKTRRRERYAAKKAALQEKTDDLAADARARLNGQELETFLVNLAELSRGIRMGITVRQQP